jgi:hypothetical protein
MMFPFDMNVEDYSTVRRLCNEIAAVMKPYFVECKRAPLEDHEIMSAIAAKASFAPYGCMVCGHGSYRQTLVDGKTWMCDGCVNGIHQERLCAK